MHAVGSPDFSTSLVPIVSWYFNARTRCGGRLFEQFRAGARTVYAHPRVDGFAQVRVYTWGRFRVPSTARSHSGGKRRTWTFPSRGFYSGRYSPMSRRAKALGHGLVRITPPAALVAHLPSQPASHANHGRRKPILAARKPGWRRRSRPKPPCLVRADERGASDGSQRLSAALDSRPAAVSAQKSADRNGSHHL